MASTSFDSAYWEHWDALAEGEWEFQACGEQAGKNPHQIRQPSVRIAAGSEMCLGTRDLKVSIAVNEGCLHSEKISKMMAPCDRVALGFWEVLVETRELWKILDRATMQNLSISPLLRLRVVEGNRQLCLV